MKFSSAVLAMAGLAAAAPAITEVEKRQIANDLNGACKGTTFIFARGSTEIGNMGPLLGSPVCSGLKRKLQNDVACQGVGGAYGAGLLENALPKGTSDGAIAEGQKLIRQAITKCPNTKIVAGGYSQGSALMNGAISTLNAAEQNRIVGVVLFGYTKNRQENKRIKNFPTEKTKIYCEGGDGVCNGNLVVGISHFAYAANGNIDGAVNFLVEKVNGAGSALALGGAPAAAAPAAAAGGLAGLLSGLQGSAAAAPAAAPAATAAAGGLAGLLAGLKGPAAAPATV